jgi:uncharacterized protein
MVTGYSEPAAQVLFGKTRRAVLSLLFGRPDEEFHLRQIVRLSQSAQGAAQRELLQLTAAGILTRRTLANLVLFRANRQSPVFPELRSLVIKTIGAVRVVREALAPVSERVDVAFIFGSVASGQESADSDLDILIIGSVSFEEMVERLYDVQEHIGREVNPVVYTPAAVRALLAQGDRFVSNVMIGEKLYIVGDADELTRLVGSGMAQQAGSVATGDS